jgi:hypothetical protein
MPANRVGLDVRHLPCRALVNSLTGGAVVTIVGRTRQRNGQAMGLASLLPRMGAVAVGATVAIGLALVLRVGNGHWVAGVKSWRHGEPCCSRIGVA